MCQSLSPEELVRSAIAIVKAGMPTPDTALEAIVVPAYATNASGVLTCFNKAAAAFAGRQPVTGKDRWCVTWKLYTADGTFLPHDQCPMAEAIVQKRSIRGITAVAERPNGTRAKFQPFPTPFFGKNGALAGAVNIFIDTTEEELESLRSQAQRCRRLATMVGDQCTADILRRLADEYDARANVAEHLR